MLFGLASVLICAVAARRSLRRTKITSLEREVSSLKRRLEAALCEVRRLQNKDIDIRGTVHKSIRSLQKALLAPSYAQNASSPTSLADLTIPRPTDQNGQHFSPKSSVSHSKQKCLGGTRIGEALDRL